VLRLTFLGATRTVTGSKYLLEYDGTRVLVDSGHFQGLKPLRERNWAQFQVPPSSIHTVVLTHAHLDHVGGVAALKKLKPEAKIMLHKGDEFMYLGLPEQPAWIGIPRAQWRQLGMEFDAPPPVDEYWTDGQKYPVGELEFEVIHCPGHTPGHVVLFERRERKVFVGDVLFAGSIGRTDLPGGSTEQLLHSIKNKLLTIGDDVQVYSGHGPTTTIGEERLTNPFLNQRYY